MLIWPTRCTGGLKGLNGVNQTAKDMARSLIPSPISPPSESWVTSSELSQAGLHFTPNIFLKTAEFLLEKQNLKSGHVLRADILFDSLDVLKTPEEKERVFVRDEEAAASVSKPEATANVEALPARDFPSFKLTRTIIRRYIPRNAQLDRSLDQTCHFYEKSCEIPSPETDGPEKENLFNSKRQDQYLVTYSPHCCSQEEIPYYHPSLRSLALLYIFDRCPSKALSTSEGPQGSGLLSVHFLPFPPNSTNSISNRLRRTLSSVLSTHLRISQGSSLLTSNGAVKQAPNPKPTKDNLIPQHIVQNTYIRLKTTYSADLVRDWVEKTESSKHVFEDLALAAFLIELWRGMYGVKPIAERSMEEKKQDQKHDNSFPGFVDIACGNGLLVHILLMEGYRGEGFDARRRKTWSIFPESTQVHLKERICIPKPFKDSMNSLGDIIYPEMEILSGLFNRETFIISNHADELTVWTPLLATLSNPDSPLPFLAIPCCSHSLSGARYRFPPQFKHMDTNPPAHQTPKKADEATSQPSSGDLKALRASKLEAQTDHNSQSYHSSTYGCLAAKVIAVAEEIGIEVEKTELRIPSTRNMGIVGGRKRRTNDTPAETDEDNTGAKNAATLEKAHMIIERECSREGGVEAAAKVWIKQALSFIARGTW